MLQFIKNHKLVLSAALVLVVLGIFLFHRGSGTVETVRLAQMDLVRSVSVAGKVIPQASVDLGFEVSGTIATVHKEVGDVVSRGQVLVSLDTSALQADVLNSQADLASAQAELDKLEGAGVYETSIENAKSAFIQTLRDAYTAADDAIFNKTDQLFQNPNSNYPQILHAFSGYEDLRESINNTRVDIGYLMTDWQKTVSNLSSSNYSEEKLTLTKNNLSKISLYLSDVARAVSLYEASGDLTQSKIDSYKSDINSARNNINSASQSLIADEKNLRDSISNIPIQVARVEAAKASLLSSRAKLAKSNIIAPISGIVSKQNAKIGQVATPGTAVVSIISDSYIIEAYVPEISIGGLRLDNSASVTFDAFGSSKTFQAQVIQIDPAETIRDGVSTYKVKLTFTDPEKVVRSGMTANIKIETFRKAMASVLPGRAVVTEEGQAYIYVLEGKDQKKIQVVLGEKDSQGNFEILSGLGSEEQVILNP